MTKRFFIGLVILHASAVAGLASDIQYLLLGGARGRVIGAVPRAEDLKRSSRRGPA
jgi:hypothetical protein